MDREKIEAEIADRHQRIKHLNQHLSRAECSGKTYSLKEDVQLMEEIEKLEEEVDALRKQLINLGEQES